MKIRKLMAGILAGVMTAATIPFSASAKTATEIYKAKVDKTTGTQEIVIRARKDGYVLFDWDAVSDVASGSLLYSVGSGTIGYEVTVEKDNKDESVPFTDNMVNLMTQFLKEHGINEEDGRPLAEGIQKMFVLDASADITFDEAVAAYKAKQEGSATTSKPSASTSVGEAKISTADKLAVYSALDAVISAYIFRSTAVTEEDLAIEEIAQRLAEADKIVYGGATMTYLEFVSIVEQNQKRFFGVNKDMNDEAAIEEALDSAAMAVMMGMLGVGLSGGNVSYLLLPVKADAIVSISITPKTEKDKFKLTCETDANAMQLEYLTSNYSDILLKKGQSLTLSAKKGTTFSSSNKKVVAVSSSGKITAKKAGTAIITAKVGKSVYKYRIKVSDKVATGDKGVVKKADSTIAIADLGRFGIMEDSFFGESKSDILNEYASEYNVSAIKRSDLKEIKANTVITQKGFAKNDKTIMPTIGTFTLTEKTKVAMEITVPKDSVDFTAEVGITNAEDFGGGITLRESDLKKWYASAKSGDVYKVIKEYELPAGTYYAGVVGNVSDVAYTIKSNKPFASMNKTSMPSFTLTKGKKMYLGGNGTDITYYSSNTKVATISNKGVVTAVAKGATYITVQSDTSITTYKVTVN